MNKQVVIKSSWIIHISHKLSLLQQQIWNVLLAYARENILTHDVHYIDVRVLLSHVKKTRNMDHLRKALSDLCITESYNLIDKTEHTGIKSLFNQQQNVKAGFCLLATAIIEDGFCKYSFPPSITPRLANPTSYAKINLLMQSQFKSKHTLAIYELCKDYAGIEHTPIFSLIGLRNYLGIEENEYIEFKHFNYKVIKRAISEINQKSDLSIAVKFGSKNKEDYVWFTITKKYRTTISMQKLIKSALKKKPQPILEECQFKRQLKDHGVSEKKAHEILNIFSIDEIQNVFHEMQNNVEKIINPAAWLVDAFNTIRKPVTVKPARKAGDFDFEKAEMYRQYRSYVENLIKERWESLPHDRKQTLDVAFEQWIIGKDFKFTYIGSHELMWQVFLEETLVSSQENDFDEWIIRSTSKGALKNEQN